jgi:TDG/mug DNA glycosylase family protein
MPRDTPLPFRQLPIQLARIHASLSVGTPVALRLRASCSVERARELMEGAGFEKIRIDRGTRWLRIRARRARSLPDWIRPGLDLLICGLNPSLYAADRGIPFARPGNRFWAAALGAGLVEVARDPFAALARGVGFTDCVKRATRRASELRSVEYATGFARVEKLIRRYRPRATCFVGLEGWRRVFDRRAPPGWQPAPFGGRPAYLMPSTSGLNAHADLAALTAHLRRSARARRKHN